MLNGWRADERGFTLADALVAMTLALVAGAGAVTFIRSQSLALRVQAGQADLNDASRGAIELMAREIRLAGYWPCGRSATAPCPGACPTQAGSPWEGIVTGATSTLLRVQADLDGNGALSAASAATEDLTFQYDAANTKITRTAGAGGGASVSDLTSDVAAGAFAFRYYSSAGPEIVPGAGGLTAAEAAAINRVSIRLEPAKTTDARIATQAKASLWTNVFLDNYGKCQ